MIDQNYIGSMFKVLALSPIRCVSNGGCTTEKTYFLNAHLGSAHFGVCCIAEI